MVKEEVFSNMALLKPPLQHGHICLYYRVIAGLNIYINANLKNQNVQIKLFLGQNKLIILYISKALGKIMQHGSSFKLFYIAFF